MRFFYMQDDSLLHHRFVPNANGRYKTLEFDTDYKLNALGLRDHEYSLQKPPNTFRILMLGDSFTEGDGVMSHETFSKVLEARLRKLPTTMRFEVINAGVPSYSSMLEYLYLKHYGLQLNPDVVMIHFDLSDIYDDIEYAKSARFDENGNPVDATIKCEDVELKKEVGIAKTDPVTGEYFIALPTGRYYAYYADVKG
ncbi:MAG: hypothetical protein HY961_03465, partial [Ignavibacteriae bacterium]|nr:hypothetical protein [Ignavibacteriota bacterium]